MAPGTGEFEWQRASESKPNSWHAIEVSTGQADVANVLMRLGPNDVVGWSVPRQEWEAFLAGAKAGEFDNI
jgi:hypothetical protein